MYLKYLYLVSLAISSVAGICLQPKLTKQLKTVALLCVYTFLLEISVFFFKQDFGYEGNTLPQYNFFILVEFIFYAYFFKQIVKNVYLQKVIKMFLFMFPVLWYIFSFYSFNILQWSSYAFVFGGTFIIFFALIYCYEKLTSEETTSLFNEGEFWIAIGLIVYYTCVVPYMGMFHYLTENYEQLAVKLKKLNLITNIIMYCLFAYAFLCRTIKTEKSSL
ncbi:hypothetical protein ACUN24_21395 [Pedobacter sp. WC2501]|uniref:hypothetical protein n=1 Tax=Pedobacter sp. WC2501 TaxID=3461400 RepID=UPI0040453036